MPTTAASVRRSQSCPEGNRPSRHQRKSRGHESNGTGQRLDDEVVALANNGGGVGHEEEEEEEAGDVEGQDDEESRWHRWRQKRRVTFLLTSYIFVSWQISILFCPIIRPKRMHKKAA